GPRRLLLGRGNREPAAGAHHGAVVRRGGDHGGEAQRQQPHRRLYVRHRARLGSASPSRALCLMEITLLAVGRLRPALREAGDDYTRRISRHARFTEIEVREAARAPSPALQREQEAVRLRARLPAGAVVVALAREGQGWTSEALAARLRDWQVAARPLAFMIGGSHGLDASLLGTA